MFKCLLNYETHWVTLGQALFLSLASPPTEGCFENKRRETENHVCCPEFLGGLKGYIVRAPCGLMKNPNDLLKSQALLFNTHAL